MANRDPAFLFYSDNFISGTQFFTDEQLGKYIRLLCAQHQHGHLKEKHMIHICKTYDEDIWSKFVKDADGLFYNERLEFEMIRRKKYTESRSENRKGSKGKPVTPKKDKFISKTHEKDMTPDMETGDETLNEVDKRKRGAGEKPKRELNFGTLQDSFSEKWDRWIKFKKDQFKQSYKTQDSEQTAINHLIEISGGDCIVAEKIINQSISNTWKGLFKLNENTTNGKSNTNTATNEPKVGRLSESSAVKFKNLGEIKPFSDYTY